MISTSKITSIMLIMLMLCVSFHGQVQGADPGKREHELLTKLKSEKQDGSDFSRTLYQLGVVCISYKPADASNYAKQLYKLGGNLNILRSDIITGSLNFHKANYDSSAICFERALNIYETNFAGNAIGSDIYNNMANLKVVTGNHKAALEYYLKALAIDEKNSDYESMCAISTNISQLYGQISSDTIKQLEYARKALDYAKASNDNYSLEMALATMGNLMQNMGRTQEGLDYQLKSLELSKALGSGQKICFALLNVGCSYYDIKDFKKSEKYLKEALTIAIKIGHKRAESYIYLVLSDVFRDTEDLQQSKKYILLSLDTKEALTESEQGEVLEGAMKLFAALGDRKGFEQYFNEYSNLKQKTNELAVQKEMLELEAKYESEKKALQITALEKDKRFALWAGSLAVLLFLSISIAFFFAYRYAKGKERLAEQQLKRLEQEQQLVATQAALEGEATERSRLARDLHDGLGGMLAAVKVNMQNVKNMESTDDAKYFGLAVEILDNSIKELRRVAHHLMPESLIKYGLKTSLEVFCQALPNVKFHHYGNDNRLEGNLETLLYRSAHELVYNALKYSEATQINVQLVQEHDRVSLIVQDNGKGFDTSTEWTGMGLNNIKQRALAFNGEFNIFSEQGKGTEISLDFNKT